MVRVIYAAALSNSAASNRILRRRQLPLELRCICRYEATAAKLPPIKGARRVLTQGRSACNVHRSRIKEELDPGSDVAALR